MSKNQRPLKTFRAGGVSASVWKREHNGKIFYNVSIVRNYRDEHGNWASNSSFTFADLPVVTALSDIAFRYITDLQDADAEADYEAGADEEAQAA